NVIVIENHDIYVREADCPDHTCIKMGKLSRSSTQIVCLPNRLMIYRVNSSEEDGTDGTA
ncbi:MAG: NusG domain II-containing protein, partial [Ruminococcus sp.]|nr:NusG domain II-containing protein [Ruminococcus sp.]